MGGRGYIEDIFQSAACTSYTDLSDFSIMLYTQHSYLLAKCVTQSCDSPNLFILFNTLSWQTVTKHHNYNKAVLVYKALNNLTPAYISDLLTPISQSHHRTLRSTTSGSLAVPRSKKAMYDGSFSSSAPRLWNTLPESVKKSTSLKDFKRCVKDHI